MASLEERFKQLVEIVQSLPKDGWNKFIKFNAKENFFNSFFVSGEIQLNNDQKLKFYGYFKQVTVGDINTAQPYFFNVVERYKLNYQKKKKLSVSNLFFSELNGMLGIERSKSGKRNALLIQFVFFRNAVKGMSKEAAMQAYLDEMKEVEKKKIFKLINVYQFFF